MSDHKPLPELYYDTVCNHIGTVTLYPDFDAVMFQPRTGQDRPDQFSPDVAGKRLRLVTSASQRCGIAGTTYSEEAIDWDAKLNALRAPAPTAAKEEAPAPAFRPTFAGLAEFADTGFLQEVNRLVLHPSGRALSFTSDKETGAILDVTIWVTDDPAGIAFLPDTDTMTSFVQKAERVAKEIIDRSTARLKDPDLKGHVIEPVSGEGETTEHLISIYTGAYDPLQTVISNLGLYDSYVEILPTMQDRAEPEICAAIETFHRGLNGMVKRGESFLLADDVMDASPRQTGAHDAAMRILGYGGKDPDPRTTMRGEIGRLSGEVERLQTTIDRAKRDLNLFLAHGGDAVTYPEQEDQGLSELLAKAIKTTDPSRLTPSEIANLRAMWGDPDGGQIRAVRWYRERFTPYRGLSEALRDVRVILGLPTVSLEERVEAIQHADRMRTAERAMSETGNNDPISAARRAWMRAIVADEIAHNKGQPAWCGWLLDALDRVDLGEAFGSAFVAVNDAMHPDYPSDWLRDLRACQTVEDFNALRDRAIAAMTPDQSEEEAHTANTPSAVHAFLVGDFVWVQDEGRPTKMGRVCDDRPDSLGRLRVRHSPQVNALVYPGNLILIARPKKG